MQPHLLFIQLSDALPSMRTFLDIVLVITNISTSILTLLFLVKFFERYPGCCGGNGGGLDDESRDDKLIRLMKEVRELKQEVHQVKELRTEETSLMYEENQRLRTELANHMHFATNRAFEQEMEVSKVYYYLQ
jgi:hypothetical protein